jgi:threonine dehydrogenase-like Zn-dependent dehydrogenase
MRIHDALSEFLLQLEANGRSEHTQLQHKRHICALIAWLAPGDDVFGGRSGAFAEYVAVAVREALLVNPQPDAVVRYSELAPYDSEVLEVCLASLDRIGGHPHPAVPLLKGRLAVSRR